MSIRKEIEKLPTLTMMTYKDSFVSGDSQSDIKTEYYFNNKNGRFYSKVYFTEKTQGPPQHVHGGAISAVLDESMGGAAWMNGYPVVTSHLSIKYMKPIRINSELFVETWLDRIEKKKIFIKGRMEGSNNVIYAESEGTFTLIPISLIKKRGGVPSNYFERIEDELQIKFNS